MKRVRTRKTFKELFKYKEKPKYLTLFEVLYGLQKLDRGKVGFDIAALAPVGCKVEVNYKDKKYSFTWAMKRNARGKLVTAEQTTETMKTIFNAYEHIENQN